MQTNPECPHCGAKIEHLSPTGQHATYECGTVFNGYPDKPEIKVQDSCYERQISALRQRLEAATELLREIRDGEVNAECEADKFLRDHEPSELSKLRQQVSACLTRMEVSAAEQNQREQDLIAAEQQTGKLREALEASSRVSNEILTLETPSYGEERNALNEMREMVEDIDDIISKALRP